MATALRGPRQKWRAEDLIHYFEAYLHMKHAAGVKEVVHVLNRLALQRSCVQELICEKVPSPSVLRDLFLSVDIALMITQRQRHQQTGSTFQYFVVDSLPQGNHNWLLIKSTSVDTENCHRLATAAEYVASESKYAAEDLQAGYSTHLNLDVYLDNMTTLRSNLVEHTWVPAAIGLSHANTAHKAAAFLHSCSLEVEQNQIQDLLVNTVSFTSDLGVEIGIPGFRSNLVELLPPWRHQQLQELQADESIEAAGENATTLLSTFAPALIPDGDSDAVVEEPPVKDGSAALELEPDMVCVLPDMSCSSRPQASRASSPFATLLQDEWKANLAWHSVFLPFAIPVPGMLHITSNLLADVDTGMAYWPSFWAQLSNLSALLSNTQRLEKFRAACVNAQKPESSAANAIFSRKLDALYSKRWGSVSFFVRRCKEYLSHLRDFWTESLYCGGQDKPDKITSQQFSPSQLTATLQCAKFSAYCDMVTLLHGAIDALAGWSEGCYCHPPWLGQAQADGSVNEFSVGSATGRQLGGFNRARQTLLGSFSTCPMQSRRAPELAAGTWKCFVEKMFSRTASELAVVHQNQLDRDSTALKRF